jgi:hypothetical protein
MAEVGLAGIACGSCGTVLPTEWMSEPRDQRSPCPKCRGTQRRPAIAKSAPPEQPRGLFARIAEFMRRRRRT